MAAGLAVLVLLLLAVAWLSSSKPLRLDTVTPADGTSVGSPPAEVVLAFGDELRTKSVFVRVTDTDGTAVDSGTPRLDGQRVITPVTISRPGAYVVTYRLALTSGEETSGVTGFSVGAPATGPQGDTGAASGHAHDIDGVWNAALLVVDAVLLPAAVLLMIRRPRVRRRARPAPSAEP
ncbi:copper resistance protein CopC [Streptomyces sp. SP17BM10]|uniref:copper resistance CopC family protein n=1 Tax=Streptomyces sp. SP17BM10 TaxID=3002530 RepID=UPI002E76DA92|nr:copper resistance CopC family protein [Streptomyces sp. SP17BM10]MEE1784588.1 copper resistance protein CopC [Streptomyces sp. SP17BM10]